MRNGRAFVGMMIVAGMFGVARLGATVKDGATSLEGNGALHGEASGSVKQFDLVCVGRWSANGDRIEPFRDRFRIDLNQKSWCREGCVRISEISSIEKGKLQLSSANADGEGNSLSIDRVSGKLYGRVRMDGLDSTTFATCKSAPFSGFPETQF